jgi:flagellar hook-associated protein FlgK
VSINSEMTRMVQAQNAYAAAAKLSSTIDQMLGDLISMVQ